MGMVLRTASLLTFSGLCLFGQARDYGRSMVITQQGMAATSQTLASQAGAQILAKGGSAVDAAIAANAVLGVVEPMMNGIGGDLFVIYWDAKSGKLTGLNASGPAPRGLSADFLDEAGIPVDTRRHPQRHGAGSRRRLGQDARALRQTAMERSIPVGDRVRRGRFPGDGRCPALLGRIRCVVTIPAGNRSRVSAGRPCAARGRRLQEPRNGPGAANSGGPGPRRILQRRNRIRDSQDFEESGRHDDGRGSFRFFRRVGRADFVRTIADGVFTSCLPTARESPRSRC